MRTLISILAPLLPLSGAALAHGARQGASVWLSWQFDWWVVTGLAAACLLYGIGLLRMRGKLGPWRVIGAFQAAAFAAGMLVLLVALMSPIDRIADDLFSVHMVQHMLLLFVAPPLLVLGRPPIAFMWALRSRPRRAIGRLWTTLHLNALIRTLMCPTLVWVLFSGLFILWHLPKPYTWAVQNQVIHAAEHLCFFVSGLMFWTLVIEPSGRRRLSYAATAGHVVTSAVIGSLPAALLVLAPQRLYPVAHTAAWGLTPLQDQQLAGAIMWVPGGTVYVAALAWLFASWFADIEWRQRQSANSIALLLALGLATVLLPAASNRAFAAPAAAEGSAQHGHELILETGCGACHVIPGISGADATVGPPLTGMGRRVFVAGMLRNTPDNLARWIEHPQQIAPGNAMPEMGISARQAQDIAAYLETLR